MFYKLIDGDYITAIGRGNIGTAITETEYNEILSLIRNKPARTETTDYRLKTDLTWEPYAVEPMPDPEPTAEEVLDIIMGVSE